MANSTKIVLFLLLCLLYTGIQLKALTKSEEETSKEQLQELPKVEEIELQIENVESTSKISSTEAFTTKNMELQELTEAEDVELQNQSVGNFEQENLIFATVEQPSATKEEADPKIKPAKQKEITKEQIDRLADKVLKIHGITLGDNSEDNNKRAERLKGIIGTIGLKLSDKMVEMKKNKKDEEAENVHTKNEIETPSKSNVDSQKIEDPEEIEQLQNSQDKSLKNKIQMHKQQRANEEKTERLKSVFGKLNEQFERHEARKKQPEKTETREDVINKLKLLKENLKQYGAVDQRMEVKKREDTLVKVEEKRSIDQVIEASNDAKSTKDITESEIKEFLSDALKEIGLQNGNEPRGNENDITEQMLFKTIEELMQLDKDSESKENKNPEMDDLNVEIPKEMTERKELNQIKYKINTKDNKNNIIETSLHMVKETELKNDVTENGKHSNESDNERDSKREDVVLEDINKNKESEEINEDKEDERYTKVNAMYSKKEDALLKDTNKDMDNEELDNDVENETHPKNIDTDEDYKTEASVVKDANRNTESKDGDIEIEIQPTKIDNDNSKIEDKVLKETNRNIEIEELGDNIEIEIHPKNIDNDEDSKEAARLKDSNKNTESEEVSDDEETDNDNDEISSSSNHAASKNEETEINSFPGEEDLEYCDQQEDNCNPEKDAKHPYLAENNEKLKEIETADEEVSYISRIVSYIYKKII